MDEWCFNVDVGSYVEVSYRLGTVTRRRCFSALERGTRFLICKNDAASFFLCPPEPRILVTVAVYNLSQRRCVPVWRTSGDLAAGKGEKEMVKW